MVKYKKRKEKKTMIKKENFRWDKFLQRYELAVEGFILKMEGIKKQHYLNGISCPIEIISGRIKTPDSILDKAKRMNVPFEYIDEKIHDIGGIRITCKYLNDVYKVRDLLVQRNDFELIEERDYIKKPKPSGYRSLHLIVLYHVETINGQIPVLLEFQIRTHAMHFWASIEHSLKYKFKKQVPHSLKERLITASFAARTLDMEMSAIHDELISLGEDSIDLLSNDPMESEILINNAKRW